MVPSQREVTGRERPQEVLVKGTVGVRAVRGRSAGESWGTEVKEGRCGGLGEREGAASPTRRIMGACRGRAPRSDMVRCHARGWPAVVLAAVESRVAAGGRSEWSGHPPGGDGGHQEGEMQSLSSPRLVYFLTRTLC